MNRKPIITLVFALLLFTSISCQLLMPSQPTAPAATAVKVIEMTATRAPAPTATEDFSAATQAAERAAQATQESKSAAATQAAAAKATQGAEERLSRTAEVIQGSTAVAEDMYDTILKLNEVGDLEKTAGEYYAVDDFNENWAQLGWYQWWTTGLQPSDFVIRAHTSWESASRTANWPDAGCGFVFRALDENNHYMIYLALDGNVYMKGYVDKVYREFGKEYYGKLDFMEGEADIILIAEGDHIAYYVNDKKVFDRRNSELAQGDLALTLVSGTNKDFGTRCSITDIEVWDLSN